MKNKIFLGIITVIVVAAMFGCGAKKNDTTTVGSDNVATDEKGGQYGDASDFGTLSPADKKDMTSIQTVTNKQGEKVTKILYRYYEIVTNKNGENVTNKKGQVVTTKVYKPREEATTKKKPEAKTKKKDKDKKETTKKKSGSNDGWSDFY